MDFHASVFLQRIEGIKAAITSLDEGTQTLSRGVYMLRRSIPAELHTEHQYLAAMDDAINRMLVSHAMLLEAVDSLPFAGR